MQERLQKEKITNERFSPQYVLLYTFSHLFMRELSNQCGYSVASLKERIYSTYKNGKQMCGILIYTSTTDSDGSLGGLVEQAKTNNIEKTINKLIENASWCSSDPICITSTEQGVGSLNYAACYSCTLIPETSCEFRNILLDRTSIIGTIEDNKVGFFK